jgi:hypothetical protein
MSERLEKVKEKLAERRIFLEKELEKVKKTEELLLTGPDEVIEMLFAVIDKKPSNYGLLVYETRKAINSFEGSFNVRDLRSQIKGSSINTSVYSKASLAGCLARLKQEGVIEEIKKGTGSRPTQYKRKDKKGDII